MRACRHIWVAWLISLVMFNGSAVAGTVPAFNGKMNTAVGSVISTKVGKWGFAANDPRIAATATGVGSGLTTLAIGVAGGAVATVGWPALLVGAGISALVGGAVALATDAVTKWLFNPDGTITQSQTSSSGGGTGGRICYYPTRYNGCYGSMTDAAVNGGGPTPRTYTQEYSSPYPGYKQTVTIQYFPGMPITYYQVTRCTTWNDGTTNPCTKDYPNDQSAGIEVASRNAGSTETVPTPIYADTLPPPAPVTSPASNVAQNLTDADMAKPISDELLAAAANAAWKAADTSKGGIPWSASDPITPADVAAWRAANPSMVPTVGDAVAPVSSGNEVSVAPATSPQTGPVATPGTGQQVDLGPNPNTPSPVLENTPTAQQVLSPILNLMPDLKNFSIPAHASECPKPSFSAFGQSYAFESHCGLVENNRSLIQGFMLLVWSLTALFIVLRA